MREDEIPDPSHSTFGTLGMNELKVLKDTMLEYVRVFRSLEDFGVMMENLPELNVSERTTTIGDNDGLNGTGRTKDTT